MECSLCGLAIGSQPIIEESDVFCCHGCHAVYRILSAKNALGNYMDHPVFRQAVQAGLISNADLLEKLRIKQTENPEGPKEKLHLEIGEMWCPSCAELIRLVLLQQKGIVNCIVDYATDLACIEFSPLALSKDDIKARISSLGYRPLSLDDPDRRPVSFSLYLRFIIAAFCSLNVMMFAYPLYATYFNHDSLGYGPLFAWLSMWVSLPVATYCAWPIYRRCWSALLVGIMGMELLVTIGVSAAFGFSLFQLLNGSTEVYFDSMTVVVVFVLLGKIIESKAKFSAKETLLRLHKSLPKRGRKKMPDGSWTYVPVKEIRPGDIVQTLAGEKVVLDGIVVKGRGACDESLMTGEAMPVVKETGARVMAGSLLQSGVLEIETVNTPEESALQKILEMVENDMANKSAYVRAVDPVVKAFVPGVILFALLVFAVCFHLGVQVAALRMLAVLLISCPCAIGIAAPLAESYLMHALTNLGAIVRNRAALRLLGEETTIIFDKTGTATKGRFEVISGLEELTHDQMKILKGMTLLSTHPISVAVSAALDAAPLEHMSVEELAGLGLHSFIDAKHVYLGSQRLMQKAGVLCPINQASLTPLYFSIDGKLAAVIYLGDQLRPEIKSVVGSLAPAQTMLLSGDIQSVVETTAKEGGFDSWEGEMSPLEKREVIETLKQRGEIVCFIGDGINDAPALTVAHIGISVLSAADISIQVSDILLTTDKLTVLQPTRLLARQARSIIKQNLFWAFFYNIAGIALAAFGWLSPIFAAAAMVVSSLIVLLNAQRLR